MHPSSQPTSQTVLVHGAAGNVGVYTVQMARHAGLQVIATANARDLEAVGGLGAQEVIDYRAVRLEDAVTGIDAPANEPHEIQEQEDSMFRSFLKRRHMLAAAAVLMSATLLAGPGCRAADDDVSPVTTEKLPNVPGKSITAIVVNYAPGAKSDKHHHAGSVLAYVLSGEIRSENSATGPVKVYKAGESFFEPPGSKHLVSENASATDPASLLAIFIADDGATLTTFDK